MFPLTRRLAGPLALAGVIAALLSASTAQADVIVTPSLTSSGTLFNYSYSVSNHTDTELAVINLAIPTQPDALTNLVAPDGFQIAYTPNEGFVSFLEGSDPATLKTFAPGSTISGFSFSSLFGPGPVAFDTLDIAGNATNGTTTGPAAPGAVPEPGTLASFGIGGLLLAAAVLRRRQTQSGTQISLQ